ncbi:hypothetical protein [Hasllibacter sp. MH4015]|uniref:hypothetical protein n=1 Tax=Hasllibacter sp. MH4015 TaxID=2854029 RepID=UPI001CD735E4|nr:hypothetical protein [Hasllibacter sp. MH4015]
MQNHSEPTRVGSVSRNEKLSALASLLGPEALAKLRVDAPDADAQEVDQARVDWHRNKLLERLRQRQSRPGTGEDRVIDPATPPLSQTATQADDPNQIPAGAGLDQRLARNVSGSGLAGEHPAVIARLLGTLARPARIEALRSLPGPMARGIVQRLRELP